MSDTDVAADAAHAEWAGEKTEREWKEKCAKLERELERAKGEASTWRANLDSAGERNEALRKNRDETRRQLQELITYLKDWRESRILTAHVENAEEFLGRSCPS